MPVAAFQLYYWIEVAQIFCLSTVYTALESNRSGCSSIVVCIPAGSFLLNVSAKEIYGGLLSLNSTTTLRSSAQQGTGASAIAHSRSVYIQSREGGIVCDMTLTSAPLNSREKFDLTTPRRGMQQTRKWFYCHATIIPGRNRIAIKKQVFPEKK